MSNRRPKIEVGDTVRSIQSGREYVVEDSMVPISGGHYWRNRVFGVVDPTTGLPNAFYGDEIEKVRKP